MPSSRRPPQPGDRTRVSYVSCICRRVLTKASPGKPMEFLGMKIMWYIFPSIALGSEVHGIQSLPSSIKTTILSGPGRAPHLSEGDLRSSYKMFDRNQERPQMLVCLLHRNLQIPAFKHIVFMQRKCKIACNMLLTFRYSFCISKYASPREIVVSQLCKRVLNPRREKLLVVNIVIEGNAYL